MNAHIGICSLYCPSSSPLPPSQCTQSHTKLCRLVHWIHTIGKPATWKADLAGGLVGKSATKHSSCQWIVKSLQLFGLAWKTLFFFFLCPDQSYLFDTSCGIHDYSSDDQQTSFKMIHLKMNTWKTFTFQNNNNLGLGRHVQQSFL